MLVQGCSSDGGRPGCSVAAGFTGPIWARLDPLGLAVWLDLKGTGVPCGRVRSTTVSTVEAVPSRAAVVPLTPSRATSRLRLAYLVLVSSRR